MEPISQSPTWKILEKHKLDVAKINTSDLFKLDQERFKRFSIEQDGFLLDFSKNKITQETLLLLLQLAEQAEIKLRTYEMFSGDQINITEQRAVLHTALRNTSQAPILINNSNENIMNDITQVWNQMESVSDKIRNKQWLGFSGKPINHIINIGIGGSDLGPKMVVHALENKIPENLSYEFVSNIDGTAISRALKKSDPETTLFIISSKSFSTIETLTNADTAKHWLLTHTSDDQLSKHFIAVTAKREKAKAWGLDNNSILAIWDWVGGRYSLWSAIGLPIAILCGMENFKELLAGAHAMDEHFKTAKLAENLPILLALMGIWNHNFLHMPSNAILPYCEALKYFPDHLQQVDMESNGKGVDLSSRHAKDYQTGPIIWGAVGTNGQHSFHQLLHQGTAKVWCDFILPIKPLDPVGQQHEILTANCFAQSQALMQGKHLEQAYQELLDTGMEHDQATILAPHKTTPGDRPSTTLLFPELTPYHLGRLMALYEHKIFTQGVIWQVNSFDQWGVEIGKKLADDLLPMINSNNAKNSRSNPKDAENTGDIDNSTASLINFAK